MNRSALFVSGIAAIVATLLSGCGGNSSSNNTATTTVGGTVNGVPAGTALLLTNNGGDTVVASGTNTFTFDAKVQVGAQYNVALFTQPSGLNCTIANAQGTIDQSADPVTNVAITCQSAAVGLPMYNVGAQVSGLASGNSVTLLLYGNDPLTISSNGLFVFSQALSTDEVLPPWPAVTIGTAPSGQSCTIAGNPGTRVYLTNFVGVTVTCQ